MWKKSTPHDNGKLYQSNEEFEEQLLIISIQPMNFLCEILTLF